MARGVYIGNGSKARSVKKGYIGARLSGQAGHPECIVSSANTLLYSLNGRNYKKAYAGDAYGASVIVSGEWIAPMLVGQTPESVCTYTDGNYSSGVQEHEETVTFHGQLWYISSSGAAFQSTVNPGGTVIHLNALTGVSAYESRQAAALDLLQYAAALPAQDHIAHTLKKAYIGVGGVARPCWNNGTPTYYGTVTPLRTARALLTAAPVGRYALFAAGNGASSQQGTVDAFNEHLARSSAAPLSEAKNGLAGIGSGTHALFAGGSTLGHYTGCVATVDAYDAALTKTTPTAMSQARRYLAAVTVGGRTLLCGGSTADTYSTVDVYNETLTRTAGTPLSAARSSLAGASSDTYALLAGGGKFSSSANKLTEIATTVDAYDSTLTRHAVAALSLGRSDIASAKLGCYSLFAGGFDSSFALTSTVEAYNTDLTKTLPAPLSAARGLARAVVLDEYVIIHGGNTASGAHAAEIYDDCLTKTVLPEILGNAYPDQYNHAGTSVGAFALFGGGYTGNSVPVDTINAYTLI